MNWRAIMNWRADFTTRTDSPEATVALGAWFGSRVEPGTLFDLRGSLGAGKTHFVRGLAHGMGIERGVRSPTFTICIQYPGAIPLHHLDAYRLEDPQELLLHGWDEMLEGVVAVEWAEKIAELLPTNRLQVNLEHENATCRNVRFRAAGSAPCAWLQQLSATH